MSSRVPAASRAGPSKISRAISVVAQQVSVEHHSSNDVAGVGAHAVGNEDKDVGIRDRVQEVRRLTRDTFHVDNAVGVNPRDRVREV